MQEYKFNVNLCGGCAGGELSVKAKDFDKAYDKAMDLILNKLSKAFPTLSIDVDIEAAEDYEY